jgi:protein-S-isoprenylcysteine O-methyltransferase Ste14
MHAKKTLLRSAVVLYFVIALEVLIMISPFAGFFYALFNPVLLKLAAHPSTRWLSAFYLPHMVLPQDWFLQFVRVMGSLLFVLGMAIFLVCAAHIYTAKFTKKGAVLGGLYAVVRHPQYLALGVAGLGLSILWPRILTVLLWLVMTLVYYFLAKDEERRMLNAHEHTYRSYMDTTGMFLPRRMEKSLLPSSRIGKALFACGLAGCVIGGAFLLRAYTIHHLTLWTQEPNVTGIAILPEDGFAMDHRMPDILGLTEVQARLQDTKQYLVYVLPPDYIMQGMIADTGGNWKLFNQPHALPMIADWIFNPFGHLRAGHHAMHGGRHMSSQPTTTRRDGVIRRLVFLSIEDIAVQAPTDLFAMNGRRVPQFMLDVDLHNMRLLEVRDLLHGSGWGTVPTPRF